jgi:HPt (histidine-containing phosphotransfer) domain-containing protein
MNETYILSCFADDPDMQEILVDFCNRLPDTVRRLQQAFEMRDMTSVQRISHQMKGAGGGYGFESLSIIGAQLEAEAKHLQWSPALSELADEFIRQCQLARPNLPAGTTSST